MIQIPKPPTQHYDNRPDEHRRLIADYCRAAGTQSDENKERIDGHDTTLNDHESRITENEGTLVNYSSGNPVPVLTSATIQTTVSQSVVKLTTDYGPAVSALVWERVDAGWSVVQDADSLWDATNQHFDVSGVPSDAFARLLCQGQFGSADDKYNGCMIGLGVDGNDPGSTVALKAFGGFVATKEQDIEGTLLTHRYETPWVPTSGLSSFSTWIIDGRSSPNMDLLADDATWWSLEIMRPQTVALVSP